MQKRVVPGCMCYLEMSCEDVGVELKRLKTKAACSHGHNDLCKFSGVLFKDFEDICLMSLPADV